MPMESWRAFKDALKAGDGAAAAAPFEALRAAPDEEIERLLFELREKEESAKRRFIAYANQRVEAALDGRPEGGMLLLVPFCLQWIECPHRIIWHPENCKACGHCPMGELREIAGEEGFEFRVSPRAVFAWSYVQELRPAFTLAVACVHELFDGLLRARAYRVYGVELACPAGRCRDTKVDPESVAEAIKRLVPRA